MQQEQDITAERWLPAPGFEGLYEVSDMGKVKSLARTDVFLRMGMEVHRPRRERILKHNVLKGGYHQVSLHRNGKPHYRKVHRLVLLAFVGSPPPGQEGRHLDGDKDDNRLCRLNWGTKLENAQDKHRHGTMWRGRGELCGTAKLCWDDVDNIRICEGLLTSRELADLYGVKHRTIRAVWNEKTWKKEAA